MGLSSQAIFLVGGIITIPVTISIVRLLAKPLPVLGRVRGEHPGSERPLQSQGVGPVSEGTEAGAQRRDVFVSGTAAIKGHETVALGDTRCQLEHTLENLRHIFQVAGLGADLRAGPAEARHFKIYLRHADALTEVAAVLAVRTQWISVA